MIFIYSILIISLLTIIIIAIYYNKFVRNKNKTSEAWSGIEVQLKRRYSLIPNLLSTVKAIATHEESIIDSIAKYREQGIEAQGVEMQAKAENKLSNSMQQILELASKYPDLQANKNFLDFQNALEDIEKQIQLARRYYNAVVRDSNNAIESFPGIIFANFLGFQTFQFFEVENYDQVKENPEANFK